MEEMNLIWKSQASSIFKEYYDWYRINLGYKAAGKFADSILNCVELLRNNPFMGKVIYHTIEGYEDIMIRGFVEHKNHEIIYYIKDNTIYIADIWACKINH